MFLKPKSFRRHRDPKHSLWERDPENGGNYTSQQEHGGKRMNSRSGATTGKCGAKLHTSLLLLSVTNGFISQGQTGLFE